MDNDLTEEELILIRKQLMRAYNELCKIEKVLKKGSDSNEQTKKISKDN